MDLVDDDRLDVDQGAAHRAVSIRYRLSGVVMSRSGGRRMSAWRSLADGVAGAHRHRRLDERHAEPLGRERDAHERRAQVLLDVEREGPQRRDVEHPGALLRDRRGGVVVSRSMRGEERGERLARPGGGADERVLRRSTMAGHPCTCGGVGSGNDDANHSRTAGENRSSTGWWATRSDYDRGVT